MAKTNNSIEAAQAIIGDELDLSRLDQIYDLQRLMGPVIAYKRLLEIIINTKDEKEARQAAQALLTTASEDPEKIADRLRASVFSDISIEELEGYYAELAPIPIYSTRS